MNRDRRVLPLKIGTLTIYVPSLPGRLVLLWPAAGQGAYAQAELPLEVGQGRVIGAGPAGAGAVPKPGERRFIFTDRQPTRPPGTMLGQRHVGTTILALRGMRPF